MTSSKTEPETPAATSARPGDSPLVGMASAALAFLMLALMTLFAKLLSEAHHVIEIAFWRNIVALIPFLGMLLFPARRGFVKIRSRPRIIAIRAVVGTVNLIFVFGAFALLPMANATALVFASALFIPVLGLVFLGEGVGPYRASAVVLGFIGVLIVAQPSGESWNLLGVALGLGGAFLAAALGIMLRVLGQSEAPETVTFYFLLIGALFLLPVMPFIAVAPTAEQVPLLIGLGAAGFLMQICLTVAFKYAPAAVVAPFNYTQILWAALLGWLVFAEIPTSNIIIGSAIIIASSMIVILRERYLARQGRLKRESLESPPTKPL